MQRVWENTILLLPVVRKNRTEKNYQELFKLHLQQDLPSSNQAIQALYFEEIG